MLINFPHHHQSSDVLIHTFIEVLELNIKIFLDLIAGGQALEKIFDELYILLNWI